MTKVRDTTQGQSIQAYVIMKGSKLIAKVQARFTHGGSVQVDVWNFTDRSPNTSGKAGGYGYDKFTAALSGQAIDGHTMTDHCGERVKKTKRNSMTIKQRDGDRTFEVFKKDFKAPRGYRFANSVVGDDGQWYAQDCYRNSGLDYLKDKGYTVIQAI